MSATRKSILVILVILVADQVLKILVKTNMTLYQQIPLLGNWAFIHFVENNGMAFGLNLPGSTGKIILTLFRIGAVVAIGFYLRHLIRLKAHPGLIISLSMIMAGAFGNIIDSVFYGVIFDNSSPVRAARIFPPEGGYAPLLQGKVVDMFYFPIIRGNYPDWIREGTGFIFFRPVFNLADASITVAVAMILFNQKRFFRHLSPEGDRESSGEKDEPAHDLPETEQERTGSAG